MQNAPFFNRHALHLRPDPSRVVVRPFRLASEPREFNPTDKRASTMPSKGCFP
jgi:capsid protein